MTLQSLMHVQTSGAGVVSRRSFLRRVAAGGATAGLGILGWKDAIALHAAELRKQGMACILLFMRGGPSQFETFDPKPGGKNGGPTKAIATAASGIEIAEHWPQTAKRMNDIALVRSMSNREGEHQRAAYQLHTGYVPLGSIKHPTLGSIVASEIAPPEFDLPHFVGIGNRVTALGSGFLGTKYAAVHRPECLADARQRGAARRHQRSALQPPSRLAEGPGKGLRRRRRRPRVDEHQTVYASAAQMVLSPRMKAFDVSQEKDAVRDRYGRSSFGQGCLLARRLVETGVTFVEVESNGWDTHQDNFKRVKSLADGVDPALAALVGDLKERGMLERTLVIWMGEFGRTPKINPNTGRDHFPRAFNVALAGGGIKGGRVIGRTSDEGTEVKERPVSVADLFCTFCQALKINPRKENIGSLGRPIKLVDGGAAVKELF